MNIINIEHISKVFGEKQVFDDISCGIHQGDKIGIIGINGTGKTTLLKIIAGLEEPDQGQVIFQKGLRVTYLPQSPKFPELLLSTFLPSIFLFGSFTLLIFFSSLTLVFQ